MRIAPIGPERHGEPDKENHSQNKKQCDCLTHEIAGTASANARPRNPFEARDEVETAENVPSPSSIRRMRLVASEGSSS